MKLYGAERARAAQEEFNFMVGDLGWYNTLRKISVAKIHFVENDAKLRLDRAGIPVEHITPQN